MSWENWIERNTFNEFNSEISLMETVEMIIEKYDLRSKKRNHDYIFRRFYLFHVLHRYKKMSFTSIGRVFGLDHATVINGLKRYENEKNTETFKFYTEDISKINWVLKR